MQRSLKAHLEDPRQQAMYGIVHGGSDADLRRHSAEFVTGLPFDGFAVGGTLGKDMAEMEQLLAPVLPRLPARKPRHVLGIGDDRSMEALVRLGADTFDSCYPTRVGRHGTALTSGGRVRVLASRFSRAFDRPLDRACRCPTCQNHSIGYINHLIRAKEPLAGDLISLHNLHFMCNSMRELRQAVLLDRI
uniref:Queuine tRNA-ribosyltransferase n=1 Tax=Tetraselmis sp. GSL018 TaxID=582737 RepID=A0A061SQ46_9CHLO